MVGLLSSRGFQIPAGALDKLEDRAGRVLECTTCGAHVRVYEATQGARSDQEHRWIDPDAYRCGDCIEEGVTVRRSRADIQAEVAAETKDGIPY